MYTANIGIMAHIDAGRATTTERTMAVGNVAIARLRNNDTDQVKVWNDAFSPEPITIVNMHSMVKLAVFMSDIPKMGPTGKPPRNKAKTKAQRKARKR